MAEQKPLVLAVDDDPSLLLLLERLLVNAGYRFAGASGGEEALKAARAEPPALVLTDAMMPGLDGYELCARLQAEPALSLVPVVFLTALDDPRDKARALACGAVDHLPKPIAKAALLDTVARHADASRRWSLLSRPVPAPAAPAAAQPLPFTPFIEPDSLLLGVLPAAFCRSHRVVAFELDGARAFAVDRELPEPELVAALRGVEGDAPRLVRTTAESLDRILSRPAPRAAGAADDGARSAAEVGRDILETAVYERASDVHIEPKPYGALVRLRVDGDMRDAFQLKADTAARLVTSFKVQGRLDVAERRKPQDGSFQTTVSGRAFVVRLATFATPEGESLVLRLLEPWAKAKPLSELGMAEQQVRHMVEFAGRNNGLLLFAGPTGSGKTTTIYSLLQHIDCKKRSLISIEDPVEYRIADANQQQVDEKAGATFEALLKSSMRQDPDILFLGEMRDSFSAKMAIDFSSTGHLTVSSLHTTNATTAVFRLERLGITRAAMSDSLLGVVAQKLLKTLCAHCKETGPITAEERAWFAPFTDAPPALVARPRGCARCAGTGHMGREGVYEIVKFYPAISEMIRAGRPISEIRDFAKQRGDYLLPQHAIEKVGRLLFSPRAVYEEVLLEEAEYRLRAAGEAPAAPAPAPAPAPASPAPSTE
ncbi:MAG: ATPase, T2SS/T4P/T4SS family, partial [Elusimicrobiota bacterium]|nr:ATPase, T2SS/T4P/T4SS family [Elusimicrobiota bacterium]